MKDDADDKYREFSRLGKSENFGGSNNEIKVICCGERKKSLCMCT